MIPFISIRHATFYTKMWIFIASSFFGFSFRIINFFWVQVHCKSLRGADGIEIDKSSKRTIFGRKPLYNRLIKRFLYMFSVNNMLMICFLRRPKYAKNKIKNKCAKFTQHREMTLLLMKIVVIISLFIATTTFISWSWWTELERFSRYIITCTGKTSFLLPS